MNESSKVVKNITDVSDGVRGLKEMFDTVASKYMLMNGNIEKPLKFLVGAYYEHANSSFSYAMDKRWDRHEIDMVGFVNGREVFATEFKCTFSYDQSCTRKARVDACKKIKRTLEIDALSGCAIQIVHFLNHSRQNSGSSLNPEWIKKKCPKGDSMTAEELLGDYRIELEGLYRTHDIYSFKIGDDVGLDAIVIRVN